jgi:rhodanese-related sulfurtransferase
VEKHGMNLNRIVPRAARLAFLLTPLIFAAAIPLPGIAQTGAPGAVAGTDVPKGKQTTLGLYVTAAEAYDMWKAAPDTVKVIDVRTPEEYAFVGHAEMAWNIPLAFAAYQMKDGKFVASARHNETFVDLVRQIAQPTDTLLVMCRAGGRGAMAVNQLAAAGFTNVYNIVDGMEGDLVEDPRSVYFGKRMVNGWKNSAPWVYTLDPEKIILEEEAEPQKPQ